MHDEFMQKEEHGKKQQEEQHRNNDQFNAWLDSILATLQTIVNNQEDEKFNGRNSPVSDGILPNPRSNIRMEEMDSYEGNKMGYNMALPRLELTSFHGENFRGWLRRCRKFFKLHLTLVFQ
jgi:hypothetical protein